MNQVIMTISSPVNEYLMLWDDEMKFRLIWTFHWVNNPKVSFQYGLGSHLIDNELEIDFFPVWNFDHED